MKHTPEPWGVNPERLCEVRQCDENDVPRLQLVADTSTVNARVPWRENARRIVACVNACEGIPTSRLEAGAADILAYSMELKRQRDELLEALEYSIKQVPELATVPGISAAIAKATGDNE